MQKNIFPLTFPIFVFLLLLTTCAKDEDSNPIPDTTNYPTAVNQIITNKCATAGCHNDISKVAAAGLSLSTWDNMFKGSRGGSPVIPFRADQSFLLFFINTNPDEGIVLAPTMPINQPSLTSEEYKTISDWITAGAPNEEGAIKFADNDLRRKFYVTNQGCDMVSVFDAETQILMRYIDVGSKDEIESPHQIKVSPDGKYWYTIFFSGSTIQKFDASDDSFVGEAEIGAGNWNTFRISNNGKYAYVVNWSANGSVAVVDLETMELTTTIVGNGLFQWPHGSMLDESNNTLYVTAQHGNFIYKVDITDIEDPTVEKITLNEFSPTTISWLNAHEMEMAPDQSKYFVTCEASDEVRIVDTATDTLLEIITTGNLPQEMALSESTPYLFVTCTEDDETFPGKIGSVHVIDYTNNTLVKTIYTGYQPHGIAVDDQEKLVYVAHRNISTDGPAPHHSTDCGGRNGYITVIDLNTLELIEDSKVEISVDPYSISLRE